MTCLSLYSRRRLLSTQLSVSRQFKIAEIGGGSVTGFLGIRVLEQMTIRSSAYYVHLRTVSDVCWQVFWHCRLWRVVLRKNSSVNFRSWSLELLSLNYRRVTSIGLLLDRSVVVLLHNGLFIASHFQICSVETCSDDAYFMFYMVKIVNFNYSPGSGFFQVNRSPECFICSAQYLSEE